MSKKISVIGLGYVGLVSAVCFSKLEHKVIGVDINEDKIAKIRLGLNPLERVGRLDEYIKKYSFEACLNKHRYAIMNSDISFVSVETPSKKNGSLDLRYLKNVCRTIGRSIKKKDYHSIVIRSTIFPGSLDILRKEIEKYSGKKDGEGFDLTTNPEFLREETAVDDFFNPSYIVVGARNQDIGQRVMDCYEGVNAKKFIVDNDVSQMIKYINNTWHACKVAFTNEVGNICNELDVDADKLMELFCEDEKLNVSTYYHKVGGPFGGHCLPKDLSALQDKSKKLGLKSYLINSISKSNEEHKTIYSK